MPAKSEAVYVATNGFVISLSAASGEENWRVKLPKGTNANPVTLLLKGERLLVGGSGRVWCLDRRSGAVLWENGLPKTGFHAVLLAMEGATGGADGGSAVVAEVKRQQEAAAAASASAS